LRKNAELVYILSLASGKLEFRQKIGLLTACQWKRLCQRCGIGRPV